MSTPAVTIVVPGFDIAAYADEALDSLLAQTRADWTAVLVDDGSTDATGALFEAAAARDPRFRVVHHGRQRGLAAARNTALALVETPLVGFLDADDRMTPTALDRLVGTIERTGSDVVVGAYVRLRPTAEGDYRAGPVQPWVAAATDPARVGVDLASHPDVSGNVVAWSKVSRTELWRRIGLRFPEGRLYEDQVVAQTLYARARAIDVVPDVVVEWRERADGSSITQRKDALPVLSDYLDALRGGISVLDAAGMQAAVRSRVALILTMDLPPLVRIAQRHPDAAYRRLLGGFARELWDRAESARGGLDEESATLAAAARLW